MTFENKHMTPIHSIRAFCIQCMGYQTREIKGCTAKLCPLFPYRMGKRPKDSTLIPFQVGLELTKRKEGAS